MATVVCAFQLHHVATGCICLQDEQQMAKCVAEANVYALAAHQYWGTWSFLQVGGHGIHFCRGSVAGAGGHCPEQGNVLHLLGRCLGMLPHLPLPCWMPPCRPSGPRLTLTTWRTLSCGGASITGGKQSSLRPQTQFGHDARPARRGQHGCARAPVPACLCLAPRLVPATLSQSICFRHQCSTVVPSNMRKAQ